MNFILDYQTLLTLIFTYYTPVFLGLLLVYANMSSISLGRYMGIAFFLTILKAALRFWFEPGFADNLVSSIAYSFLPIVAGLVLVLVLAGIKGNTVKTSSYASILIFVSLYPWDLGALQSMVVFLGAVLVFFATGFVRSRKAFKEIGVKAISFNNLEKHLSEDEYRRYCEIASVKYPPVLIASVVLGVFVYIAETLSAGAL